MIVALVAICMGLLCIPGMEWLKLENTSVVQTGDDQVPRNIEEAKKLGAHLHVAINSPLYPRKVKHCRSIASKNVVL
jgi:hypothetical protein